MIKVIKMLLCLSVLLPKKIKSAGRSKGGREGGRKEGYYK
jgi:hypothetical protein